MLVLFAFLAWVQTEPPAAAVETPPGHSRFEKVETPEVVQPAGSRVYRRQTPVTASERDAAWTMHRLAECLVRTRRRQMVELLQTRLNSPEQMDIVEDAIGWKTRCLQARTMAIDNVLLRGAVAEALYRQELRGRDVEPLERAPAAARGDPARHLGPAMETFGRCMLNRHPDTSSALIGTRPGSRQEREALQGIEQVMNECLTLDTERARHLLMMRGAIAEAFYLRRKGLLPTTASTAQGTASNEAGEADSPPRVTH